MPIYICERVHVRRIDTLTRESCLIVCTAMFNEKPSLIPLINSWWCLGAKQIVDHSDVLLANSSSDIALENLTVVPDSFSSVQLEWKVVSSDGHHCIRNYSVQIVGPNGSHWEDEIPGSSQSFHFTGIQLIPLQEYTYCVTANLVHGQIGLKLTVNFTELQGGLAKCHISVILSSA